MSILGRVVTIALLVAGVISDLVMAHPYPRPTSSCIDVWKLTPLLTVSDGSARAPCALAHELVYIGFTCLFKILISRHTDYNHFFAHDVHPSSMILNSGADNCSYNSVFIPIRGFRVGITGTGISNTLYSKKMGRL